MARKDVRAKVQAKLAAEDALNKDSNKHTTTTTTASTTATTATSNFFNEVIDAIKISYKSYTSDITKSPKLRLIDLFLTFLVALGILQFIFVILVGNFPFNAFLGGFISTIGQFVLTVSLRLQSLDSNAKIFKSITPERALGDYIFASLILHFIVFHFIN